MSGTKKVFYNDVLQGRKSVFLKKKLQYHKQFMWKIDYKLKPILILMRSVKKLDESWVPYQG